MTVISSHHSVADARRRGGWTPARIVSAVMGVVLVLCSLGLLGAGGVALWASTTQRHGGDIDLGTWSYHSTGYAVVSSTTDPYGATGGLPCRGRCSARYGSASHLRQALPRCSPGSPRPLLPAATWPR